MVSNERSGAKRKEAEREITRWPDPPFDRFLPVVLDLLTGPIPFVVHV